jgi:hypothetical protein
MNMLLMVPLSPFVLMLFMVMMERLEAAIIPLTLAHLRRAEQADYTRAVVVHGFGAWLWHRRPTPADTLSRAAGEQ